MKKAITIMMLFMIFGAMATPAPASAQHCDVRKGDSMWRIAKRYHVLFHDVLRLNPHYKNPNMIHPNDEIELPDGNTGETTNQPNNDSGDDSADRSEITSEAKQILNLVNQERAKQNLPALTLSQKLTNTATIKAKDMRDNHYFDHQSPTYGSPFDMLKKFGVSYSYAGENIAAGQKTPSDVMNSWMNSSGHRANILNKNYTQLGVGYVTGGNYGTYWVQQFIKP